MYGYYRKAESEYGAFPEVNQTDDGASPSAQTAEVVSFSEWIWALIIAAIPLVNLLAYAIWAFGEDTNPSKANWAKATLTLLAVVFFLGFLIIKCGP